MILNDMVLEDKDKLCLFDYEMRTYDHKEIFATTSYDNVSLLDMLRSKIRNEYDIIDSVYYVDTYYGKVSHYKIIVKHKNVGCCLIF